MQASPLPSRAQLEAAFQRSEERDRVPNTRVGCWLVILLMPFGTLLDWFVYEQDAGKFLILRLVCSACAAVLLGLLHSRHAEVWARRLGALVPLLPVLFIAWMIHVTEGFASPYYAGMNLVLLAVGAVLRWSVRESLVAVVVVAIVYVIACVTRSPIGELREIINSLYFIALMDVIFVVGVYFQGKQRFLEFSLRHEIERNQIELEKNQAQLVKNQAELEKNQEQLIKNQALLEEKNKKLEQLDEIKGRFFANISHELRTPLTLLLAPLETLLQQGRRIGPGELEDHLQTMHSNGMRLLKLINDLLDLVRLESGRIELRRERVALADFIPGIIQSARKVAQDRHIRLESAVSNEIGPVLLDCDKVERILLNLLFNAIKFTPAGGSVSCHAERVDDKIILEVRDTGMGIARENLPHIFDRFWQADTSSKRKYQGVGIGLAIVKELVEAQGGRITADSETGKGTRMTIELPYLPATKAGLESTEPSETSEANERKVGLEGAADESRGSAAGASQGSEEWLVSLYRRAELFPSLIALRDTLRPPDFPDSTGPPGRPRILIADDEPDMLRFLRSQLLTHFQVLEAVDGLQAIDKAAQFLPDIILCDMMMPERDGLQVCKELRSRASTKSVPIVLLTARADEQTKIEGLKAGANDFLSKPFSTAELHVRLQNLVALYQSQRQLVRQNQILESTLDELKETEIQLVQSEKLAALGRMSAGIIHEINNPLNFAKTGMHVLGRASTHIDESHREEFVDTVKDIDDGLTRVAAIISDLRAFTHPHPGLTEDVLFLRCVESALRFMSADLRDRIQIQVSVPKDFTVVGNENKFIQVLVNLLQNSVDALREKAFPEGEHPEISIVASENDGQKRVVVRDNGPGIPEDVRQKIFEPFFTTKEIGSGTGLGLSICYRILAEAGAEISVQSEVGKYCEFIIDFASQLPPIKHNIDS